MPRVFTKGRYKPPGIYGEINAKGKRQLNKLGHERFKQMMEELPNLAMLVRRNYRNLYWKLYFLVGDDEINQVCNIGVMHAISMYDPDKVTIPIKNYCINRATANLMHYANSLFDQPQTMSKDDTKTLTKFVIYDPPPDEYSDRLNRLTPRAKEMVLMQIEEDADYVMVAKRYGFTKVYARRELLKAYELLREREFANG